MAIIAEIVKVEDIRGALARGYCIAENENKELDSTLLEAMTNEIASLDYICTQPASNNSSSTKLADELYHIVCQIDGGNYRCASTNLRDIISQLRAVEQPLV